jgi:hypothetical protein
VPAVVAIGVAAIAAGVAVAIARHHSGGGSFRSVPSAGPSSSTSQTVSAANQSVQSLYRLLPRGYDSTNCKPVSSPNKQALATLQCGQASDPHGPASAAPDLLWTNDHDLLLSDIQGPDLGALYQFWSNL